MSIINQYNTYVHYIADLGSISNHCRSFRVTLFFSIGQKNFVCSFKHKPVGFICTINIEKQCAMSFKVFIVMYLII